MSKTTGAFFLIAVAIAVTGVLAGCGDNGQVQTSGSGLAEQSREGGGVTVKVTPQDPVEGEPWSFNAVFDTHSVELSQDPVQISTLIADGKEYKPLTWEGDPAGGHHREGTLTFPAISPRPKNVELTIKDVGGVDRSFDWTLE